MPSLSGDKILEVFFSYSHKHEALCDQPNRPLGPLKPQERNKKRNRRRVPGGHEWPEQIEKPLQFADLILPLVTPDFLHSDFWYLVETSRALLRHESGDARVI